MAGFALPIFSGRETRIAEAQPRGLTEAFPGGAAWMVAVTVLAVVAAMVLLRRTGPRLVLSAAAVPGLLVLAGTGTAQLVPQLGPYGRAAPGAAIWIWLAVALIWLADATRRPGVASASKVAAVGSALVASGMLVAAGWLDSVSIMAEYHARAGSFRQELATHVLLALGSFGMAFVIGFPLALILDRRPRLRRPVLSVLTGIQTIPSIALFGLMILPLAWLAAHVPGVSALGISGIGFAPAFLALLLYSLLPVVANTVGGLQAVPAAVAEAARAMGMSDRQRRWNVELPLAVPAILTGARIVLVQNIGLATVGALIGAGGLGTYVFQGLTQGAMDLVLLGALPTVLLAFAVAWIFDAAIALVARRAR